MVALRVPGGGAMPRGEIDDYTKFVGIYGAKGLAYIKVNDVSQGPTRRPASRRSSRTCPMTALARNPRAHRRRKTAT